MTRALVSPKLSSGAIVVCVLLQLLACNHGMPDQDIDAEIQRLVRMTASPKSSSVTREVRISRSSSGIDADWQVTTSLPTEQYLDSLRKMLAPEYQNTQRSGAELTMHKVLPGDVYNLHLVSDSTNGAQAIIQIRFTARPD